MDRPRLKILYISQGYTTHDYRFLSSFVRAGWNSIHLPLTPDRLDARPLPGGVETLSFPERQTDELSASDWQNRRDSLVEILAATKPDAVIAGPIQSGAYLAALSRAKPLIAVSWGTDILVDADASADAKSVTRFTLDSADAVFGDCRAVRDAVRLHSAVTDDRIITFPWGIDLARFSPGPPAIPLRRELGWEKNQVFISTRSWEPLYAIDVLVRAFASVREKLPSARLILLGDGSLDAKVRGLVDELGLTDFIHAPGRVNHGLLPEYFRSSDTYVSAAVSDGTSISLLEAMACGLPAVVSDSFGNLEWVREGVNGAVATPGVAESLAGAMLAVTSRYDVVRMRDANVESVRSRADWDLNFPALVALVERLAARSHSAQPTDLTILR